MQTVTREEFAQWRESSVTQEVFSIIQARIDDAKEILSVQAGLEPDQDRLLVGMIKALNEILEISYEE